MPPDFRFKRPKLLLHSVLAFICYSPNVLSFELASSERCDCACSSKDGARYMENRTMVAVENVKCYSGVPICTSDCYANYVVSDDHEHMLCSSDLSCIEDNAKSTNFCHPHDSCCNLSFESYNVSNVFGHWSMYHCLPLLLAQLNHSICLHPKCQKFSFLPRQCNCTNSTACMCSKLSRSDTSKFQTLALFITFEETFVVVNNSRYNLIKFLLIGLFAFSLFLLFLIFVLRMKNHIKAFFMLAFLKICSSRSRTANGTPKPPGDQPGISTIDSSFLPTYEEALRTERHSVIEPPPTYADARI